MTNNSEHNADLSPEDKRALLARLLRKQIGKSNFAPLSFAQQRLWFLDRFLPGNSVYNVCTALRLKGRLDAPAMEQSFNEIVRRHEVLRTTFADMDGQPVQVIAPDLKFTMPVVDLRELPESERETEVLRLITEDSRRPFDLSRGPLLRVAVLCLDEEEHVLLLAMHHIVSDGWSTSILIRELAALYKAFSSGMPSPLPDLPIQYADFATWQHEWLQGEELEKQLSYWKQQLARIPIMQLPTDHPRPAVSTYRGAKQHVTINKELTDALKAISREAGVTLFMTLLAAFKTLLYRYSGQEDIVVGSPVANRNRAEIEGLIGFFVNTLVMRTDLSGNPSFRELMGRVQEMALGAFTHQDLPFEKLVEELRPERDMSRNPLFQVMFVLRNVPRSSFELKDLTVTTQKVDSGTSKFDLTLSIGDIGQGLTGSLEYSTDLFESTAVAGMLEHFHRLLEGVAADSEARLSDLPLLTEAERHQLLVEWNDTHAAYPREKCIHELFEAQVEKTPDASAVVFEEEQLTYRELDLYANRLAHHLISLGVGPEGRVGICMERSLKMVVGLLGVLKSGGAYVPLEPSYPQDRLAFMLEDGGVEVLLTEERLGKTFTGSGMQLVCLDTLWETIARESRDTSAPASGVTAENLAYVIYTSGSTGRPKGVAIDHRSAVAFLTWAREVFAQEDLAGVLASTSICFDLSVFELFVPLSCGGKVMLVENALHLPAMSCAGGITLINTVPSVMSELVKVDGVPPSVRTINLAGEPLSHSLVEELYKRDSIRRIFNLYGPSEDTTYSTYALMKKRTGVPPPVGFPTHNKQIYILDRNLQPYPVGGRGELCIAGSGLARGYFRRPGLTAERFIPNPFGSNSNSRLYKTGDLARYLPDGNIMFIGRMDRQVKVRGFRIELGEIESALSDHDSIKECAVIVRETGQGDMELVAFTVSNDSVSSLSLRRFLREVLPDYMIPSKFIQLDAIPLTSNRKVDYRLLQSLKDGRAEEKLDYVPPQSSMERKIADIWQDVLSVDRVGIHDNFFDLGGHSLMVIRVISKIEDRLKIKMTFRDFIHQTLGQFAASCEEQIPVDAG